MRFSTGRQYPLPLALPDLAHIWAWTPRADTYRHRGRLSVSPCPMTIMSVQYIDFLMCRLPTCRNVVYSTQSSSKPEYTGDSLPMRSAGFPVVILANPHSSVSECLRSVAQCKQPWAWVALSLVQPFLCSLRFARCNCRDNALRTCTIFSPGPHISMQIVLGSQQDLFIPPRPREMSGVLAMYLYHSATYRSLPWYRVCPVLYEHTSPPFRQPRTTYNLTLRNTPHYPSFALHICPRSAQDTDNSDMRSWKDHVLRLGLY